MGDRMLMNRKIILVLLFVLTILSACNKNEVKDSPLYEGAKLAIGVVGEIPKVREENIVFKNIALEDLKQGNISSELNAVFIMKEHFTEAAKAPYAKVYKESGIPFFYIESKKSYVPFVDEETDYEDFPDTKSGDYAAGYYQLGEEGKYWGYGLYNNAVNASNILDAYSRIFKTIDEL